MKKTLLPLAIISLASAASASAAVLATPNFDADSYIEFATNNAFDPQITIGQTQRPFSGHFNWGVVEFDASTLNTSGDKFLRLSAVEFRTTIPNPMGPPTIVNSPTGSATISIVALGDSYDDYQLAADKLAWYDANVQNGSVPVIGTMSFTNQSTRYIDVTSTVNDWINTPANNHGFAIFSTSNNVELGSMTNSTTDWQPALTDSVPEPSSALLVVLGSAALILRRRK